MTLRFKAPTKYEHYGWYVCTMGGETMYLHTDNELRGSTQHGGYSTGYFNTKQKAMDAVVNYIRNHL